LCPGISDLDSTKKSILLFDNYIQELIFNFFHHTGQSAVFLNTKIQVALLRYLFCVRGIFLISYYELNQIFFLLSPILEEVKRFSRKVMKTLSKIKQKCIVN